MKTYLTVYKEWEWTSFSTYCDVCNWLCCSRSNSNNMDNWWHTGINLQ